MVNLIFASKSTGPSWLDAEVTSAYFDEDWWMSDADDEIDEEETRDLGKLDSVKFNIFWTARY